MTYKRPLPLDFSTYKHMTKGQLYFQIHGRKPPRKARRAARIGPLRDAKYRAWIRSHPCASCGTMRGIEAAHTGQDGGTAVKASDTSVIPLCADCHRLGPAAYHRIGRKDFERRWGLDLAELVRKLNVEWERKGAAA